MKNIEEDKILILVMKRKDKYYVYCTGFKYIFTLKVYLQRIVHLLFYLQ